MIKNILFLISFCVLTASNLFGNDVIEWGVIPDEHWEIQSFPGDDEAHSIILADYGESYINTNAELVHRRHLRVKILDVDESNFSEMSLTIYRSGRAQQIRDLDAHTLNLNPDNTVRVESLGRRDFHSERDNGYETTTFAFRDLQPGSIIELRYRIHSQGFSLLRSWSFQHSSPVLHSEYRVLVHGSLNYHVFKRGFERYDVEEYNPNYPSQRWYNDMAVEGRNHYYRWVLRNAPAVREDSYITTVADYRNSVRFQLSGYRDRRGMQTELRRSWNDLAIQLYSSDYFGRQLSSSRSLRRLARELTEDMDDELEMAKAIYDYVATEINWNGRYRYYANEDISDLLDTKSGNSGEKALLLTNLLQRADIDADPVLISTRGNGKVDWTYPHFRGFNHLLVRVNIDGQTYLLDPLVSNIPFGMLNPSSINDAGFLVTGRTGQLLQISPDLGSQMNSRVMVQLSENGALTGMIQSRHDGYEAIIQRRQLDDKDTDEYFFDNTLKHLANSAITNYEIINLENVDEVFETRVEFENDIYSLVVEDMIYLNPFFTNRKSTNPFRNPVRNHPIDYAFGLTENYTAVIQIPDGYEIVEIPEDVIYALDDETAFILQTAASHNTVQISSRFMRMGTVYPAAMYDNKREFYNSIASIFDQQVVLRKITASEGDDSE